MNIIKMLVWGTYYDHACKANPELVIAIKALIEKGEKPAKIVNHIDKRFGFNKTSTTSNIVWAVANYLHVQQSN